MTILDLDMDYFMTDVAHFVDENSMERLDENYYGSCVWEKKNVVDFLENNLGLSKDKKCKGRVVRGHNESLFFWKELIEKKELNIPFDVIHVDSHADLGLGYSSWVYILDDLIRFSVDERPYNNKYYGSNGIIKTEGIGDYLLFAVAYRWIASITYCANPYGENDDYILSTLKDHVEKRCYDEPVTNIIQLVHNESMDRPNYHDSEKVKKQYFDTAQIKEPEVPLITIPKNEQVNFDGNYDYVVLAQSPNYTPESADFIMDIFKEYIEEI